MNEQCLNCGVAAVLFVLVYFAWMWREARTAPLGEEIPGVGFVELEDPGKPSRRTARK